MEEDVGAVCWSDPLSKGDTGQISKLVPTQGATNGGQGVRQPHVAMHVTGTDRDLELPPGSGGGDPLLDGEGSNAVGLTTDR